MSATRRIGKVKVLAEMRQAFYKYEIVTSVSCPVVSEISAGVHMLNKKQLRSLQKTVSCREL